MIPHQFFYLVVVLGLLWIFVMFHMAWPSPCSATPQRPAEPILPRRPRSSEPKSFAGLTHKPQCVACEQAPPAPRVTVPAPPPPRLPSTRGRKRQVDTGHHVCPNPDCPSRVAGWAGGISAPMAIPRAVPGGSCCVSSVVALVSRPSAPSSMANAPPLGSSHACSRASLKAWASAARRACEVDPNTILQWLVAAAEPLRACSQHVLHDMQVRQVQLAELFARRSALKAGEGSKAEASECLERSPQWVWVAMDPERKRLLTTDGGNRTLAMAQRVVHQVAQV